MYVTKPQQEKPAMRRTFLSLCALMFVVTSAGPAMASDTKWPNQKPVTLIVGYPAGGGADTTARLVADHLGKKYNQRFVVENRPGASGTIAAYQVARAAPDGYTLLASASSELTVVPSVRRNLPYDPTKDFEPVAVTSQTAYLLVANNKVPAKTLQELVAHAKANPGKLTFGSYGQNTFTHLTGEYLQLLTGIELLHVPYKGGGELIPAVLGGQVDLSFNAPAEVISQIQAGNLKPLAVTTPQRLQANLEIPTSAEAGYPDLIARGWNGLMAPKGTPPAVLDEINAAVNEIMRSPEVIKDLHARGTEPGGGTRDEVKQRIASELNRWKDVVQKVGITPVD